MNPHGMSLFWVIILKCDSTTFSSLRLLLSTFFTYAVTIFAISANHIHTEFIKMVGCTKNLGLSTRARHFKTDKIFVHGFLPSKEPGISFSQREDIVLLLIMLSTLPPTDTMLFSILICLGSMLPITHPRPLPRVCHFYEFGICHFAFWR